MTTRRPLDVSFRRGSEADSGVVLALFDEAIRWLVARGQTGQWGSAPASSRPALRERVARMSGGGGLHLAERGSGSVGALVVGPAPSYVPAADGDELYVELLLTSRRYAGLGLGRQLLELAVDLARDERAELLRVDCWAGAPRLIAWYEEQGFARTTTFTLDGWRGQVFRKLVAA